MRAAKQRMSLAKNPVVRLVVPVILLACGVFIAWAVMRNSLSGPAQRSTQPTTPAATTPAATPAQPASTPPAPGTAPAPTPTPTPTPAPADAAPGTPAAQPGAVAPAPGATRSLRVRPWPEASPKFDDLGSLEPDAPVRMRLRFADIGAGLESLELANHFQTVDPKSPHEVLQQRERSLSQPGVQLVPFAANAVRIDGKAVNVAFVSGGTVWRQVAPGSFEAIVEDDAGVAVARLTRTWRLTPDRYDVVLEQKVENLTQQPITAQWIQTGPTDLDLGIVRYGGDKRRVRFGYLLSPAADPAQATVLSPASRPGMFEHAKAMRPLVKGDDLTKPVTLWPTLETKDDGLSLVWTAMTNRYFSVSVHRPPTTDPAAPRKLGWSQVERVGIADARIAPRTEMQAVMALVLTSEPQTVAPGAAADFSLGVYAGPTSAAIIEAEPASALLGLSKLVVYNFGGPCAFCTFQPIAHLLRWYLGSLHWIFGDWAIAIILLVVTIRTILHPVTKWSQVNIQRFAKQMQELAPKQKAIQEKYKGDPAKLREETGRLMRESNVNYSGLLGCVPAFLQMPIWIALTATLYFTFEFRHAGAFYGVFQSFAPNWRFLADLAEPDHLFGLGTSINIPLLSALMGPIDSFNILPLILGAVFYFHQKYLSPPPSAAMTPEQIAQQNMAKWIMVISFPIFMYNAPAGLTLYFITNSLIAIAESHYIRGHVKALDEKAIAEGRKPWEKAGRTVGAKPAAGAKARKPGFLARLAERVEQQKQMMEQAKAEQARRQKQQRKSK